MHFYCYVYVFLLYVYVSSSCLLALFGYCVCVCVGGGWGVRVCVCVSECVCVVRACSYACVCTVLLPPGGYPNAVNKYIISYTIPEDRRTQLHRAENLKSRTVDPFLSFCLPFFDYTRPQQLVPCLSSSSNFIITTNTRSRISLTHSIPHQTHTHTQSRSSSHLFVASLELPIC